MKVDAGSTNVSVYYYIVQDASATSPGEPVTGLLFSDIETGGSAAYARQGAAKVDLTLITLASASATHADGGFILVDDTIMPGLYRCDYPDAAFVAGVDQVFLQIVVASGKNAVAAPILVDIEASIAQTADNDTKLTTLLARIIGTLESGSHNPSSVAQLGALTDWLNGGRLDNILDARMAEASINTTAGVVDEVALLTGNTAQSADNETRLATIETDTADMQPKVAKIPLSDGVITWNATALGSINAECDTAVSDADIATETKQDIIDTNVDTLITNLAIVDGNVDNIKVKTDSLTFTITNVLDSNIQRINDVVITGDGSGSPFDV